jgi:imidazolonepropionase-like amidohydrolase
MKGDEVIERGDIVVTHNRIERVGASGTVTIPSGAHVIDAAGKTIIPGLVDVHAHPATGSEMPEEAEWNIANHLAYGVTTTRNPSGNRMTFSWNELVETGDLVGPRLYGTAAPLTTTTTPVTRYEDALHAVRRYKQQGANSLKQYLQPRRIQRQWFRIAADSELMNATNEGAADFKADLTMALDGYTGIEHSLNVVPLYKDVVQLIAQSKSTYTPTLIVAYGGPSMEQYFSTKTKIHDDPKLRRFTPEPVLEHWRKGWTYVPDEEQHWIEVSKSAAKIAHAGGLVTLGAHGNRQGLGAQWELWGLQMGGLTNMEALREATIVPARKIGMERDIGSLEPGRFADFLVFSANPLDDIRNTARLHYTVKNGFVYDAESMTQVWPARKELSRFFWQTPEDQQRFAPPRPKDLK